MLGVILAAGKGTRLKELGKNLPKTLLPIGEQTCLERIVLGMKEAGIHRFAVIIGYLGEMIEERYGRGESLGVEITYLKQDLSLYGTGRAVLLAAEVAAGKPFMVSYGDILVDPANYKAMLKLSREEETSVSSVNWMDDPAQGAAVYLNSEGYVEKIIEKPPQGQSTTNWNNAGVYVLQPAVFDYLRRQEKSQRGEYELSGAIRDMVEAGLAIKAHRITGYWQDIGSPEDVAAIRHLLREEV